MLCGNHRNYTIQRKRNKAPGVHELIAIELGGMVGGGIFTLLGVSVSLSRKKTKIIEGKYRCLRHRI